MDRSTGQTGRTHHRPDRWDPHVGERTGPAWDLIVDKLSDGHWHLWSDVVSETAPESGLAPKTVNNLIHAGVSNGVLERRGSYSRSQNNNTRSVKLINKGADR